LFATDKKQLVDNQIKTGVFSILTFFYGVSILVLSGFALNFYFKILQRHEKQIRNNQKGVLAPTFLFNNENTYYLTSSPS
jgi:hypothetical protein